MLTEGLKLSENAVPQIIPYVEPLFYLAAGILIIAGIGKLINPRSSGRVLTALGLSPAEPAARGLGAIELVVGGVALTNPRLGGTGVAILYFGFAGFLVFLLKRRPAIGSCGCMGAKDVPPSALHSFLNLIAGSIGLVTVLTPGVRPLSAFLRAGGWEAALVLFVLPLIGYAAFGAISFLPGALKNVGRVAVPDRHGGRVREELIDEVFREAGIGPDHPSLFGQVSSRQETEGAS